MERDITRELCALFESNKIEEVQDAQSLMQSWYAWEDLIAKDRVSTQTIKTAQKIIMLHKALLPIHKGYYRNMQVQVGHHGTPDWRIVERLMEDWVKDYAAANTEPRIKEAHVQFEKIHPFADGNGRTGRLIMNYQRLKAGLPVLVIKASERQQYYAWFT